LKDVKKSLSSVATVNRDCLAGMECGSRWHSMPDFICGDGVIIRRMSPSDIVVAKFGKERWHNIFYDIDSDRRLKKFLRDNPETSKAYMLVNSTSGEPFGWIYLRRHDDILCDTVEFHGGAWADGIYTSLLKFRASCLVIDRLLTLGVRVASKSFKDNRKALRFLENIGFRVEKRRSRRPYYYLRLSHQRFYQSAICRRVLPPANYVPYRADSTTPLSAHQHPEDR